MNYDELSIGYKLGLTSSYYKCAAMQLIKGNGLTEITSEQFGVLLVLHKEDGRYQRQLGQLLMKDRPNMTRMLDNLEMNGFLYRQKDEENRRISKVFITEKGRELVKQIIPQRQKIIRKALEGISEEEINALLETLSKIRGNLADSFSLQT